MRHAIREAEALHRVHGIAAADHGRRIFQLRDCLADSQGTRRKCLKLEDAHRAVPDHGLCALQRLGKARNALRSDVEAHIALRDLIHHLVRCIGSKLFRRNMVHRKQELNALLLRLLQHVEAVRELILFAERVAYALSLCL